ncbi:hypothetical protein PCS84_07220 [Escherichia coli]|nr:hypothetical protein PCS84_07220 [Escherichia coli]
MSSVMKFSVVNAVVLLLLIVLTGVFYMKKSKEIAVVNIDAIYNQSAAGDMARKHRMRLRVFLKKDMRMRKKYSQITRIKRRCFLMPDKNWNDNMLLRKIAQKWCYPVR